MSDEQKTPPEQRTPNQPSTNATPGSSAPVAPAAPAAPKPTPAATKPVPAADAAEKPKKAPPPPDPKVEAAKAIAEQMKVAVVAKFGEFAVEEVGAAHHKPMLRIRNADWAKVVDMLRTHPTFALNYLECMAGTDYPTYIEISTFVQSTTKGYFVCLKTRTERENAEVPSLVSVHPGVNWEEREIFDLLGVTFTGHPDLRRIMMWDDFTGHPLRKDYNEWD